MTGKVRKAQKEYRDKIEEVGPVPSVKEIQKQVQDR
jgi:hypothetical protein